MRTRCCLWQLYGVAHGGLGRLGGRGGAGGAEGQEGRAGQEGREAQGGAGAGRRREAQGGAGRRREAQGGGASSHMGRVPTSSSHAASARIVVSSPSSTSSIATRSELNSLSLGIQWNRATKEVVIFAGSGGRGRGRKRGRGTADLAAMVMRRADGSRAGFAISA